VYRLVSVISAGLLETVVTVLFSGRHQKYFKAHTAR
jgi:hypothetical protein